MALETTKAMRYINIGYTISPHMSIVRVYICTGDVAQYIQFILIFIMREFIFSPFINKVFYVFSILILSILCRLKCKIKRSTMVLSLKIDVVYELFHLFDSKHGLLY